MSHYYIQNAKPTGGKAGKGRNKTSTVQVFEVIGDFGYLKKHFRFNVNNKQSYERAREKAHVWIIAQQGAQVDTSICPEHGVELVVYSPVDGCEYNPSG